MLTWPAWIACARAVSNVRSARVVQRDAVDAAGGGGGCRLAEADQRGRRRRGGGQRGAGRPGAQHAPRGGRERATRDRAVVGGGELADGAVAGDEPGQRRAEQPQPLGRVGRHAALPERPGRGQPEREVAHPLARLVERAEVGHHVVDEILLRPDADLQPEPGDAPVPRVEVQVACPRWLCRER